jgi:hypothetical protein
VRELGPVLARVGVGRVGGGAGPGDDELVGHVQHLVRVRVDGVGLAGEWVDVPVVDQAPGEVPRLGLGDGHQRGLGDVQLCLRHEPGEERHAGEFDDSLQHQVRRGAVVGVLVLAGAGRDGVVADLLPDDEQVAGLVVADLRDARVGGVQVAGVREVRRRVDLQALLVERVDGPFRGQQVLEQQVIGTCWPAARRQNGTRLVAGIRRRYSRIRIVDRTLAWDGQAIATGSLYNAQQRQSCNCNHHHRGHCSTLLVSPTLQGMLNWFCYYTTSTEYVLQYSTACTHPKVVFSLHMNLISLHTYIKVLKIYYGELKSK